MAKYTLIELAKLFMPAPKTTESFDASVYQIIWNNGNSITVSFPKPITISEHTQLTFNFSAYHDKQYAYDNAALDFICGGVTVRCQLTKLQGNTPDKQDFSCTMAFPLGTKKQTVSGFSIKRRGYKWGELFYKMMSVDVADLDAKSAPTTVAGCLTTIADYARAHISQLGGN